MTARRFRRLFSSDSVKELSVVELFDINKGFDELFPPNHADRKNTAETPGPNSLESVLPRLPPEGQAWLNGLNPFCRWAIGYDLHTDPEAFVKRWEYLRDTLTRLERDLGPSDNWK